MTYGRSPEHDLRGICNAILYVNRTGVPDATSPHDYPPWQTAYAYVRDRHKDGIVKQLTILPRRHVRTATCAPPRAHRHVRTIAGHNPEPTACIIDAQSIKTSANVPTTSQGYDAGRKITGRERGIITDTLGLLLAVLVTAADVSDSVHRTTVIERAPAPGIDLEVVTRDPTTKGFTPLPRR
ncbi:transposase [Nonomuraea sp. NPDC050783]|uniref:transposase n=1 Tax=Nonomuraea sp. NPDC050783 TaxID=3154634 RepID=UPI003467753E